MLKYAILGTVQGLTEFLPVSSSAHLVCAYKLLGLESQEVAFSVILHLGTLLALTIFFFKDILSLLKKPKEMLFIAIVTVITAGIALSGKGFFESLFSSARYLSLTMLVTGFILISTRRAAMPSKDSVGLGDSLLLGLAQGLSVIPGISRSGITVSSLILRGIKREECFRFSFLAGIPAILGAALLESKDISSVLSAQPAAIAAGFVFSFTTGYIALLLFKKAVEKAKLHYFGYYCIFFSIAVFIANLK